MKLENCCYDKQQTSLKLFLNILWKLSVAGTFLEQSNKLAKLIVFVANMGGTRSI
jgi:hypothetical protein